MTPEQGALGALGATKRLVVVAPNWLGDAVMALPAIADIRRGLPHATLTIAGREAVAPLFTMAPGVDDVLPFGDRAGWQEDARVLRARSFDTAILLPNSFRSALAAWRAQIPERVGFAAELRGPLLTRTLVRPSAVHQAAYYQALASGLGFAAGPMEPRLEVSGDAKRRGAEALTGGGWNGRARLVALAPGAAYGGAKRWPASSFGSLATHLSRDGVAVVLVGSKGDRDAGDEMRAELGGDATVVDLIGKTDLPTLAGVFVHCRALVSNDSGAMHLGAALGMDVTALFGPTDDTSTSPLGAGRRVALKHDVWCRPCMLRECPLEHRCMRGISVEAALAAVRPSL